MMLKPRLVALLTAQSTRLKNVESIVYGAALSA